ncbi:hypothetical protein [Salinibacterium sp. ZJ450]|uniref:hypothetical protein n=1 Tax=Salinibacterium sp. ZJ450 TaxID=2708338 RepID=UPI00141FF1DA|nr:hypothetical protein [Salinibacterium sp. ZJ450]
MSTSSDSTGNQPPFARDDPTGGVPSRSSTGQERVTTPERVVEREQEQYGGVKIGSAFFGWLTAMGMAVLLVALLGAIGTALGLATNVDVNDVNAAATDAPEAIGITGAILLAIVLFIAYFCGGYVAGRMARFDGVKQGIAVWVWALVIAILVAILGVVAGSQFDVLANMNVFPRLPINEGTLTTAGIITAIVAALVALGGAILGGVAGMRYHRKVDRAGYAA